MYMLSARDLIRRWYGQVKQQPARVANSLKHLAAHTIIPDYDQSVFCESDFVPLPRALDLVLTSEVNPEGEVVGLMVKAFRASYDQATNTFQIGGPSNFKVIKDLKQRPHRGAKGVAFDPDDQAGMLLAAYEMDSEREAVMRRPSVGKKPRFTEAVLSFTHELAPRFEATQGLRALALEMVQPGGPPMRSFCAPQGYEGKVRRVVSSVPHGVKLIELEDRPEFEDAPEQLCFEVPPWAKVLVRQGQSVSSGMQLISVALHKKALDPIKKASRSVDEEWEGLEAYIGQAGAKFLLRSVWDSEVFRWGHFVMAPHYILTPEQVQQTCGVWRDLRGSLDRVCHFNRDPSQIIRSGRREGRLSVWNMGAVSSYGQLSFNMLGGPVDLYTMPPGSRVGNFAPNSGQVVSVAEDDE